MKLRPAARVEAGVRKGATFVTTITVRGSNLATWGALALAMLFLAGPARGEHEEEEAAAESGAEPLTAFERTPPRLSLVDGEVTFWRPGAEDWAPARVNVALAPGDQLWAGDDANLEIQIGSHAFVRAGEETELGLVTQEPDYLQFRVGSGTASLDLRRLPAGHTVELATPNGAFTIERTGYYRVEVEDDATKLTARRGGIATLTTPDGPAVEVAPSEQVVVAGEAGGPPQVETYAAPELDDWDTWNYRRTDRQLDALSARYVGDDVYGASDLDQHGSWRRVESYGPVWIPRAVPVGWAPYSHGRWLYDPVYGWTWVDDAPWGWAPFHYGRWVHVHGYWAWAPGPIVVRSYYAPALVAFYGSPHVSVRIGFGSPSVGWVPLGWGEPCVPWWGHSRWRGRPHWFGWGGPRVVNKVLIKNKTVIKVKDIRVYENEGVRGAFSAVKRKDFGRRHVREARVDGRPDRFERIHGKPPVDVARASFTGDERKGRRPPERVLERRVVATRTERAAAKAEKADERAEKRSAGKELARIGSSPEPLLVPAPGKRGRKDEAVPRPPFGTRAGEERSTPKAPPRFEEVRRSAEKSREKKAREARTKDAAPPVPAARAEASESAPKLEGRTRHERRSEAPKREARRAESRSESPPRGVEPREVRSSGKSRRAERSVEPPRRESAAPAPRMDLPGEPANRVYRGRPEREARASQPRLERAESSGSTRGSSSRAERSEARSTERAQQKAERAAQRAERGSRR